MVLYMRFSNFVQLLDHRQLQYWAKQNCSISSTLDLRQYFRHI